MQALARAFIVTWGWRRAVAAFIAGALSVLSQAPFDIFPILLLTFPVLVWLIDGVGSPAKSVPGENMKNWARGLFSAASLGWFFGFGYFLAGLYWVGAAFLVEAEKFALLMPIAVILLPAGLALFHALGVALAYMLWSNGSARIVALAVGLTIGEWLRGHILTGLPWNLIGYALTGYDNLMQITSVIGVDGLTFIAILIAASPSALGTLGAISFRVRVFPMIFSCLVLAGIWIYGAQRLSEKALQFAPQVRLRIVQPNIAQSEKWKPENRSAIFSRLLTMSDEATSPETAGIRDVTHVIWPETAVPFLLDEAPDARAAIAALLPQGTSLITGSVRRETGNSDNGIPTGQAIFNSIMMFDDQAQISAVYDKVHLVPFGEYLPFRDLLSRLGFSQLTQLRTGFGSGQGRRTYVVGDAPGFAPLICYEIIFSGAVTSKELRPEWILNLTNDAWFGDTIGPYQHFRQVRVRAVEEGLPIVRAANTGISAVIDPFGRVLNQIFVNKAGVIDSRLPVSLSPTYFVLYGPVALILFMFTGFFVIMAEKWQNKRNNSSV